MRPHGPRQHLASGISNPFEDAVPRINEYTAKQVATLQSRLDKQLGPEYISTRPGAGGGKVHYLAAEKVINLANEVFGFNGWSSAIQNVQVDFVDEAQGGKITIGLSIVVRVTLMDGTYHEDIGYGHIENCKSKAAAFEKAKKEAATDALKRALRTFGNVLGNCLYDKEYLSRVTKVRFGKQRWNIDDLHRHSSYVVKEEAGESTTNEVEGRSNNVSGKVKQETVAPTVADVEDEFGGDLFDEMDFDSHTDGVVVEPELEMDEEADVKVEQRNGSPIKTEQTSKPGPNYQDRTIPRVQSTPILRPGKQSQESQKGQAKQLINNADHQLANGRTSRPDTHEARPNAAHSSTVSEQVGSTHHQPPNVSTHKLAQLGDPEQVSKTNIPSKPLSAVPVEDMPVGFTASRNAEILQKIEPEATSNNTTHIPAITVAPFNPHIDSPSIRRTSHISHNKSAPVSRQAITAPPGAQPANPDHSLSRTTNFINPQADPTRRIGMPVAAQSPAPNRSAYKPPGMVTTVPNPSASHAKRAPEPMSRVPLADVSNAHPDPGNLDGRDVKKSRVMG